MADEVIVPATPTTPAATPAATPPAPAATPAPAAGTPNPLAATPAVAIPAATPPAAAAVPAFESPYDPTGNATVDAVVAGFHKAGVNVDAVAESVMSTGKVDATAKAALEKAYGPAVASALITNLERDLADHQAQVTKAQETAHTFFGGKESFDSALEWASANLDKGVKDMLNVGLAKGGAAMELSLNHLKGLMEAAGQTVVGAVQTPGAPVNTGVAPLAFDEYIKEKAAATRRGDDGAVKALEGRARASMEHFSKLGQRWESTKAAKK
jgi:hypothetical protein